MMLSILTAYHSFQQVMGQIWNPPIVGGGAVSGGPGAGDGSGGSADIGTLGGTIGDVHHFGWRFHHGNSDNMTAADNMTAPNATSQTNIGRNCSSPFC